MEAIYTTEIKEIGPEVEDFLREKYLILFAVGAPPELAEMSVLHEPFHMREEPPAPGDVLEVGGREFRVTAVGDKAWKNVAELGHAVFVFNGAREAEMPGQICLEEGAEGLAALVKPGVRLEMRAGAGTAAARGGEDAARES